MKRTIEIYFLLLLSLVVLIVNDFYTIATIYFYSVISIAIYLAFIAKKILFIHLWMFGFVYIILPEAFLSVNLHNNLYALKALKFLAISNNVVLIGYLLQIKMRFMKATKKRVYTPIKSREFLLLVIIIAYALYVLDDALTAFRYGRAVAATKKNFVIAPIINSFIVVVPSFAVYFYSKNRNIVRTIVVSLPIFILLFMEGSRFPLMFAFLGMLFSFIQLYRLGRTKIVILISFSVGLLALASFGMMALRVSGNSSVELVENRDSRLDFPTKISKYMSNEGVIDMTALMIEHYESHNHTYGVTSAFLFYFWIPRSIWPEKPTMLGYWFVREYRSGFSDGHSTSFGFTGELFADFGYTSIVPLFWLGILLYNIEMSLRKGSVYNRSKVLFLSMLYPYLFFFVRSPLTATTFLFGIVVFVFILRRVLLKIVL